MAGDWLPMRKNLDHELEVMRIAALTGYSRRETAMILFWMWGWFDDVSIDGIVKGIKLDEMSALCPDVRPSFWDSVIRVGWLVVDGDSLVCPNFDRWINKTAKKRLLDARRKSCDRQVGRNVRFSSVKNRLSKSKNTGPKNRTEQNNNNPPFPLCIDTPEMHAAWEEWVQHRREIRKPLTPTAIRQQLAKLATMGVERGVQTIRHSIANGWQGLFEPRKGDVAPGKPVETTAERQARIQREMQERKQKYNDGAASRDEIAAKLRGQK